MNLRPHVLLALIAELYETNQLFGEQATELTERAEKAESKLAAYKQAIDINPNAE